MANQKSKTEPLRDPLPVFVREVIALYADAFAEVRFPDLDRGTLSNAADVLRESQVAVEALEAELEATREALRAQTQQLQAQAERALAYARVFADGDAELSTRITRIAAIVPSAVSVRGESTQTRKRGRPRKAEGETGLFAAAVEPMDAATLL
jgi:hypothetical protein